jgi:hypothetical protein
VTVPGTAAHIVPDWPHQRVAPLALRQQGCPAEPHVAPQPPPIWHAAGAGASAWQFVPTATQVPLDEVDVTTQQLPSEHRFPEQHGVPAAPQRWQRFPPVVGL